MEVTAPLHPSLQDEHVLATDPPLRPDHPEVWRRRINAFTGRALSDKALTAEQDMRAGLQRLHGLSMTAGIISGLSVQPNRNAVGANLDSASLIVEGGTALTQSGEDIQLGPTRNIVIGQLPVILPESMLNALNAVPTPPAASEAAAPAFRIDGGAMRVLRPLPVARPTISLPALRPTTSRLMPRKVMVNRDGAPVAERLLRQAPRRMGDILQALVKLDKDNALPRVGILIAQPVTATILGRQTDNCPPDPRDDPYADLQRIDGVRFALFMWPGEMLARNTSGNDYSMPPIGPAWRNQLAYRIFDMERSFQGEEMHPWESWGTPIALIGFNDDWTLNFVDRASVVRRGGAPRSRCKLVPQSGSPGLWQARMDQFVEQVAALPVIDADSIQKTVLRLPPACVLPADLFDAGSARQRVFPSGFGMNAVPIPMSNLNLALREASALIPFNTAVPDRVEMLVPVPDSMYDPGLLLPASVDDKFRVVIEAAVKDRDLWLVRREHVRRRIDVLMEGVSGHAIGWPLLSSPPAEFLAQPGALPPLYTTRIRLMAAGNEAITHSVECANSLNIDAGDTLFFWVRIAEGVSVKGLSLKMAPPADFPTTAALAWDKSVYWGDPDGLLLPGSGAKLTARKIGELPSDGVWTRLEARADAAWQEDGKGATGYAACAFEFGQRGGSVDYAAFGKIDAKGQEYLWINDEAPGFSIFRVDDKVGAWRWQPVADRTADGINDYGTYVEADCRRMRVLESFKTKWQQDFLSPDMRRLNETGMDAYLTEIEGRLKATNDAIDLGFVRARADIYRVRQFMLGADSAARLVTSPSLADLAIRDEGARVTSTGISEFIRDTKLNAISDELVKKWRTPPPPPTPAATTPPPPPPPPSSGGFGGMVVNNVLLNNIGLFGATSSTTRNFAVRDNVTRAIATENFSSASFVSTTPVVNLGFFGGSASSNLASSNLIASQTASTFAAQSLADSSPSRFSLLGTVAQRNPFLYQSLDIQAQRPLPGLIERTLSVAERLKPSPAVQALEYAIASKEAVITTLAGLINDDAGRPSGISLNGIIVPGYGREILKAGTPPIKEIVPITIEALIAARKTGDASVVDIDDRAKAIAEQPTRHESDYFTAAVQAIDNAIALMRLVEDRIGLFEALAADIRDTRSTLLGAVSDARSTLRMIDVEVEEARHDISTAQALLAEETARVDALNARRKAILANHVSVIAYRRVRESDHRTFAPTDVLPTGLTPSASITCRNDHTDAPGELGDFVELLRDAPVKWFPAISVRVAEITQAEAAKAALEKAQAAAAAAAAPAFGKPLFLWAQKLEQTVQMPVFLKGAWQAMSTQQTALIGRKISSGLRPVFALPKLTLTQTIAELRERATLGDLAEGAHKTQSLSASTQELLGDMDGVVACLHARFAGIAPVIRLQWADILSQFDTATDLSQLSVLPQWGAIDRETRRGLQSLVDWIFQQIDRNNPKPVALMNDFVRVALLMAAHSPTRKLIPAQLTREAPARVGSLISLNVSTIGVRAGMFTIIRDRRDRIISRAIIHDIGDGRASARIVSIANNITTLTPDLRIELSADKVRMPFGGHSVR